MKKLINSVDGAVTDVLGGDTGALRGRAHGSRGAAAAVAAGRAEALGGRGHRTPSASVAVPADRAAAPPARTADDGERPEITRSWGAPVDTPARWER
ncbi:MAG TPA: hypothetical protein VH594_07085 [Trebonia sp.]|jgi:hypothetical protein